MELYLSCLHVPSRRGQGQVYLYSGVAEDSVRLGHDVASLSGELQSFRGDVCLIPKV